MNNISRTVGVKRIGQFTYNAALSTAHKVTTPAIFFLKNNMLSIRGYIIDNPAIARSSLLHVSLVLRCHSAGGNVGS